MEEAVKALTKSFLHLLDNAVDVIVGAGNDVLHIVLAHRIFLRLTVFPLTLLLSEFVEFGAKNADAKLKEFPAVKHAPIASAKMKVAEDEERDRAWSGGREDSGGPLATMI